MTRNLDVRAARYDPVVTVCSRCLRAACWQGEFMCEQAYSASTQQRRVSTLIGTTTFSDVRIGDALEHPGWWNRDLAARHVRQLSAADLRALGIEDPRFLDDLSAVSSGVGDHV